MDIPAPVVFVCILLAVPLQVLLSSKSSDMDYYVYHGRNSLKEIWIKLWGRKIDDHVPKDWSEFSEMRATAIDELVPEDGGTEKGYYAASTTIRDPRPPFIKFRVGQVVVHKLHKYRGVIIGWDETENAPEVWLQHVRGDKAERPDSQPNYAVLIDMRGSLVPEMGYVVQENLELAEGRVIHPYVEKYFERYNPDGTYRLRPWLQNVYPND